MTDVLSWRDINDDIPSDVAIKRLAYIDNVRIFLTILVVVHHLVVAYGGGSGRWYYNDPGRVEGFQWYVLTFIWLINQSFFMGFLFMLSGYLVPNSYMRKGAGQFIKAKLRRLGIPLAVSICLINPCLSFVAWVYIGNFKGNFWEFLPAYAKSYRALDAGVAWFLVALLLFSGAYVAWQRLSTTSHRITSPQSTNDGIVRCPDIQQVLGFAIGLGVIVFLERAFLTPNPALALFGMPAGHFSQYIACFLLGIWAHQKHWFSSLTRRQGVFWAGGVGVLTLLLPVVLVYAGVLDGQFSPYGANGGWTWQALLVYALWEQLMCVAMIITLLVGSRKFLDWQNKWMKRIARDTYAVYLVHSPLVTLLVMAFSSTALNPLSKFFLMIPVAITVSFLIGRVVRCLPLCREVL